MSIQQNAATVAKCCHSRRQSTSGRYKSKESSSVCTVGAIVVTTIGKAPPPRQENELVRGATVSTVGIGV
jgi:hypothetical protein